MNPFLYNPLATIQAPPIRVVAQRSPAMPRSRWTRAFGTLALAAGLSLAAMPVQALDLNTATIEQLRGIRGLGPKTAETIVKERERGGRFESMEDLSDRVRGIGLRRAQALEAAGLRVGSASVPASVGSGSGAGVTSRGLWGVGAAGASGASAPAGASGKSGVRASGAAPAAAPGTVGGDKGKDPRTGRTPARGTR
jgi:competence protein ComEA